MLIWIPIWKRLLNQEKDVNPYYYKSPNTLTNQGTHNLPRSSTLELWEVQTWPSEGIWSAPHRCSLLGLVLLLCRCCFVRTRIVWITVDFSTSSTITRCINISYYGWWTKNLINFPYANEKFDQLFLCSITVLSYLIGRIRRKSCAFIDVQVRKQ